MLKIKEIKVKSFSIDYLDVYWEIEPVYEDILNYAFIVQKSNNQFGPFHSISGEIINKFNFRDLSVRGSHSLFTSTYYRVGVVDRVSKETYYFPEEGYGIRLEAKLDLSGLEIARINFLKLKLVSGRKVWILPRKVFGQHCRCYDHVTRRKIKPNCVTCYDTAWVGGYDSPVETFASLIQPDDVTTKSNFGDIQIKNGMAFLPNYPIIENNFIIVDPDNNRWLVLSPIKRVKKFGTTIRQSCSIQLLPKDDITYNINLSIDYDEVTEPKDNYTNKMTL